MMVFSESLLTIVLCLAFPFVGADVSLGMGEAGEYHVTTFVSVDILWLTGQSEAHFSVNGPEL